MSLPTFSRLECWVPGAEAADALVRFRRLVPALLGDGAEIAPWIDRFRLEPGPDGLIRAASPAPRGGLAPGVPAEPFLFGWPEAAVPELGGDWLELGLVILVVPRSEPERANVPADPDDEEDEMPDRWFDPGYGPVLWRAAVAFHRAFPLAPVLITDENTEGDAFLSLASGDDEVWDFAAAILPEAWATRAGRPPGYVERRRFGTATAFADESMWVRAPWESEN